jgi:hypothetical protein
VEEAENEGSQSDEAYPRSQGDEVSDTSSLEELEADNGHADVNAYNQEQATEEIAAALAEEVEKTDEREHIIDRIEYLLREVTSKRRLELNYTEPRQKGEEKEVLTNRIEEHIAAKERALVAAKAREDEEERNRLLSENMENIQARATRLEGERDPIISEMMQEKLAKETELPEERERFIPEYEQKKESEKRVIRRA